MILTPVDPTDLPEALRVFAAGLPDDPVARAAFARIAATAGDGCVAPLTGTAAEAARRQALDLAARFGIATLDEEPAQAFSWDGSVIRALSEPAVLIHEIAHWQICPPARRGLQDFGLGAGPETGRHAEAEAARSVDQAVQEREEAMASLLGILWEAELGQPAILAFLEQNWLERYDQPGTPRYFAAVIGWLHKVGLVDGEARPLLVAFDEGTTEQAA